ncbi:hypothetical protein [Halosimplex salinum]|uniref:hypothetical protein n=1 Tax=Halosimplex salinum TaxID=1710538 RepID=UPI000F4943C9|nr:hypothetical protein [Halosimplex salinum]
MVDMGAFVLPALVVAVFGAPALVLVWGGVWKYRIYRRLRRLEPTEPGVLSEGTSLVDGDARALPDDGTVAAPVTGTECVAYEFEIEVFMEGTDGRGNWSNFDRTVVRPRFLLDGWTGDAVVDTEGFDLALSEDYRCEVTGRDNAPPEVVSYVDDRGDLRLEASATVGPLEGTNETKVRFVERRLEPGQEVRVVGYARPDAAALANAADANALVAKRELSGLRRWLGQPLVVTDRGESAAATYQLGHAKRLIGIAVAWVGLLSLFLLVPVLNGVTG